MEKICRLCLNVVVKTFRYLRILDSPMKTMIIFIQLDLDTTITKNPRICATCLEALKLSYNFKLLCWNTENFLKGLYDTKGKTKLELTCVFKKAKWAYGNKDFCRFCLNCTKVDSLVSINNLDEDIFLKDMVQKSIPEFNLDLTAQPVICSICMEKLQTLFNFIMTCQDNNEKIKNYMITKGICNGNPVNLTDVLRFIDDMKRDQRLLEIEHNVKVEMVDEEIGNDICNVVTFNDKMDEEFKDKMDNKVKNETNDTVKEEMDDEFEDEMDNEFKDESDDKFIDEIDEEFQEETDDEFEEMKEDTKPKVDIKVPSKRSTRKKGKKDKIVNKANKPSYSDSVYRCMHCPLTTARRSSLVNHIRSAHSKTGISKSIRRYLSIKDIVSGKKPSEAYVLKCGECGKRFNKFIYLDGHILTCHPELEHLIKGEVHRCGLCGYKTVHKTDWTSHDCMEYERILDEMIKGKG